MIDDLITALENLQKAKAEYKESAKIQANTIILSGNDSCLQREMKAIDDAKEELVKIFRSAIITVVVDVINSKSYLPE